MVQGGAPTGRLGVIALAAILLVAPSQSALAQRLPLPPDEQDAVNRSVDRGVDYLKKIQLKNGTWAPPGNPHPVGYAVLPGLTLLECGVPASDPVVQRSARFLRSHATKLDSTYELSLAILFLDRFGCTDPKDEKILQTFALRLIAGQSATGGWGYKCPILSTNMQMELMTALRHLDPAPPEGMAGIAAKPGAKVGGLELVTQAADDSPRGGTTTKPGSPPLSGTTTNSRSGESRYRQPATSGGSSLWRDWLGFSKADSSLDLPESMPDEDAKEVETSAEDKELVEDKTADGERRKPYVIPERLRLFTVIRNPARQPLQDPVGRAVSPIATTTDNSNTQFAILALWTARRHDVPMKRTLDLIVRRYLVSQNDDGSWGYHYHFGGDSWLRPAPMTCVGLIGLAVGHGLAERKGNKPVRDPRILNGLVALSHYVGKPVEQPARLSMQNLYFMWSLERVAVLYNLPKIGDKDWYRWGSQVLVDNQRSEGHWTNGQYPGNSPPLDTSLALLFLKRANLVKDLTSRLPFQPEELHDSVMEKLTPPPAKSPEPIEKTIQPPDPSPPREPDNLIAKPIGEVSGSTATKTPTAEDVASAGSCDGKKKWIALSLVLFVILAGGSLFFFLVAIDRKKDEAEDEEAGEYQYKKRKRS